jgi:hypothetical protein
MPNPSPLEARARILKLWFSYCTARDTHVQILLLGWHQWLCDHPNATTQTFPESDICVIIRCMYIASRWQVARGEPSTDKNTFLWATPRSVKQRAARPTAEFYQQVAEHIVHVVAKYRNSSQKNTLASSGDKILIPSQTQKRNLVSSAAGDGAEEGQRERILIPTQYQQNKLELSPVKAENKSNQDISAFLPSSLALGDDNGITYNEYIRSDDESDDLLLARAILSETIQQGQAATHVSTIVAQKLSGTRRSEQLHHRISLSSLVPPESSNSNTPKQINTDFQPAEVRWGDADRLFTIGNSASDSSDAEDCIQLSDIGSCKTTNLKANKLPNSKFVLATQVSTQDQKTQSRTNQQIFEQVNDDLGDQVCS